MREPKPRACEAGKTEFGTFEVGVAETGTFEVGTVEIGTFEVGTVEIGTFEVGAAEIGTFEVGVAEKGAFEVGAAEIGTFEVGAAEIGTFEVGAVEIGASQVRPFAVKQVEFAGLWLLLLFQHKHVLLKQSTTNIPKHSKTNSGPTMKSDMMFMQLRPFLQKMLDRFLDFAW